MLELPSLLLRPWSAVPGGTSKTPRLHVRIIAEPRLGAPVGLARQRPPSSAWAAWLCQPTVDVCENQDQSLLCTVQRFWSLRRVWEVRDADLGLVGRFSGAAVRNSFDCEWAGIVRDPSGRVARFFDGGGAELASVAHTSDGATLTFASVLKNPFARMLLLAAVLTDERPHSASYAAAPRRRQAPASTA